MKKEDLMILASLRQNSRVGLTKISKNTSIPVTTIYNKLKNFEKTFIKKYTSIIDFPQLGFNTRAVIMVRTKKEMRERLYDYLSSCRSLNSLYKINNGYDFLMEIIAKEIKEVEFFVEHLENAFEVDKKEIHYLIEEIKKENFISNAEYIKLTGDY